MSFIIDIIHGSRRKSAEYVQWFIIIQNNYVNINFQYSPVLLPYEYVSYLRLDKVKDSRFYKCRATNSVGNDYKNVEVKLKEVFKVLESPSGNLS